MSSNVHSRVNCTRSVYAGEQTVLFAGTQGTAESYTSGTRVARSCTLCIIFASSMHYVYSSCARVRFKSRHSVLLHMYSCTAEAHYTRGKMYIMTGHILGRSMWFTCFCGPVHAYMPWQFLGYAHAADLPSEVDINQLMKSGRLYCIPWSSGVTRLSIYIAACNFWTSCTATSAFLRNFAFNCSCVPLIDLNKLTHMI